MSTHWNPSAGINFGSLTQIYDNLQSSLATQISNIAAQSNASPAKFLMLQFQMSMTSQIGDSISNMMSSIQGISSTAIRNLKGG
jgi:hypothetical protein